ncbi:MAG: hypothetical protein KF779_03505 [Hyphomonadaceae bacterium]|nr:hypothetical protein [Hyphomonadaceae bacterium]
MRALLLALAILLTPVAANAQTPPDTAAQHAAMERLTPLVGRWEGIAAVQVPHVITVYQTEDVTTALEGAVMLVRGAGFGTAEHTGDPVFDALAVISYDDQRRMYEFRAYAMGRATTATGEFLGDGQFRWSINPGGPVRIRYTITFTNDTWNEVGEMSSDGGTTWRQTIELNLHRAP